MRNWLIILILSTFLLACASKQAHKKANVIVVCSVSSHLDFVSNRQPLTSRLDLPNDELGSVKVDFQTVEISNER